MNSGIAAIISLFVPGLGQCCQGRLIFGVFLFCITVLGYLLVVPGIIFHFYAVINAATWQPYRSRHN